MTAELLGETVIAEYQIEGLDLETRITLISAREWSFSGA